MIANAESNSIALPTFDLHKAPTEKPTNQQKTIIPSTSDQKIDEKTQSVPQYIIDILRKNKGNNLSSLASKTVQENLEAKKKSEDKAARNKEKEDKLKKEQEEKAEFERKKAAEEEKIRQLKKLEEEFKDYKSRPFYDRRKVSTFDKIHKSEYGPNNQHLKPYTDIKQYSKYFFIATIDEDITAIKELLDRGANINAIDTKNNYTALMYAIENEKYRSVNYLIQKGANLNAQNNQGHTALHIATTMKNYDFISALLKMNANVEIADHDGNRPAFYYHNISDKLAIAFIDQYMDPTLGLLDFVKIGSFAGIMQAINRGANINGQDAFGNTPLMLAIPHKNPHLVALILKQDPDLYVLNQSGENALKIAGYTGDQFIWSMIKTSLYKKSVNNEQPIITPVALKEPVSPNNKLENKSKKKNKQKSAATVTAKKSAKKSKKSIASPVKTGETPKPVNNVNKPTSLLPKFHE